MGNRYKSPQGLGRLSGPALSLTHSHSLSLSPPLFLRLVFPSSRGETHNQPFRSAVTAFELLSLRVSRKTRSQKKGEGGEEAEEGEI